MSYGTTIRSARRDLGMSQRQVAGRIRKEDGSPITQQYLNDIELDRRRPGAQVTTELARVLHLNKDALHTLAGQIPPDVDVDRYKPEKIAEAMKAFRKELRR